MFKAAHILTMGGVAFRLGEVIPAVTVNVKVRRKDHLLVARHVGFRGNVVIRPIIF